MTTLTDLQKPFSDEQLRKWASLGPWEWSSNSDGQFKCPRRVKDGQWIVTSQLSRDLLALNDDHRDALVSSPDLAARVIELEAENARLRDGLKPFADVAKVHHINIQHINNDAIVHEWMDAGQSFQLTVGDFRKARAALKGGEI